VLRIVGQIPRAEMIEFGSCADMNAEMLRLVSSLLLLGFTTATLQGQNGKIIKVLPHYLDAQGRQSLSPSLYERDAYQDFLRKNPDKQSALRFDVHWKAKGITDAVLRVEVRTSQENFGTPLVVERQVQPKKLFGTWTGLKVSGDEFRRMGNVIAWRASLWSGDRLIADQKSFLW
jgi:hypothetical protein